MWTQLLEQLRADGALNAGATPDEIGRFTAAVKETLGVDPPPAYLETLRQVNGLEYNGVILYGIDGEFLDAPPVQSGCGLIGNNLDWRYDEEQEQYLFLGDGNIDWYVYQPAANRYLVLDKPSGSEVAEYAAFQELLEAISGAALL